MNAVIRLLESEQSKGQGDGQSETAANPKQETGHSQGSATRDLLLKIKTLYRRLERKRTRNRLDRAYKQHQKLRAPEAKK